MTAIEADFRLPFSAPVARLGALKAGDPTPTEMDSAQLAPASADAQAEQEELIGLLAATALRDRQAFQRLYQLTSAHLYGVALRLLEKDNWAQDVLQEAYIRIWNNSSSYQSHLASPKTWMTTIVRNLALDLLRKRKYEVRQADPLEIHEEVDSTLLPADKLSQSEEGKRLSGCLDELKREQRQIIALAYFKGYTHDELSGYTGQPLGTVKTWIRRGLDQLRRCLES